MGRISIRRALIVWALFSAGVSARADFVKITQQVGIKPGLENWVDDRAAWGDFNNDGWVDLIASGRLYKNLGTGAFEDVTEAMSFHGKMAVWFDFNGDEYLDVFCGHGATALFINKGGKGFVRASVPENPYGQSHGVSAADLDGDGWVDLYVSNFERWENDNTYPLPDVIFKNRNGQTLEIVPVESPATALPARGVTACDYDQDGSMELFVSVYRLGPNRLWKGDSDIARAVGAQGTPAKLWVQYGNGLRLPEVFGHTIGSAWGDLNNDGLFDVIVGNFSHPIKYQDRLHFLKNLGRRGDFRFEAIGDFGDTGASPRTGIQWKESYASVAPADFDNDGRLDFFVSTAYESDLADLYKNQGDFHFEGLPNALGITSRNNYQAAWADFDHDGDLDLMTGGHLYRNEIARGNWLQIDLHGLDRNRAAIGAQAEIILPKSLRQVRQVEAGVGTSNQSELTLHFGLGHYKGPLEIKVRWPSGGVQRFQLSSNRRYSLLEEP